MPDDEFFRERTYESGVTEHERIVEIDGRKVVIPAGAPVSRGSVRWGRRPVQGDESADEQAPE